MKNNPYQQLYNRYGKIKKHGLWPTSTEEPNLFHAHVNALIALGLFLDGKEKETVNLIHDLNKSCLKNKNGLFNYSWLVGDGVLNRHHSCTQGMIAFALALCGKHKASNQILDAIFKSKMFNQQIELFIRAIWSDNTIADNRIITHSNLWIVLALIANNRRTEAKKILGSIKNQFYCKKHGLLFGTSCKHNTINFFADDNALYAICLELLGFQLESKQLLISLIESQLFDKQKEVFNYSWDTKNINNEISSYKNNITQAAYKLCEFNSPTFNTNLDLAYSDSITLGLFAKNAEKLRTLVTS